jgi:hypothetical protein
MKVAAFELFKVPPRWLFLKVCVRGQRGAPFVAPVLHAWCVKPFQAVVPGGAPFARLLRSGWDLLVR